LTEGFWGVAGGGGEAEVGDDSGLRFFKSPFAATLVDMLEEVEVDMVGWLFASGWEWACVWECPPSPVAMRKDLSMATNATKPTIIPTPNRRLRLGSRRTNLTLSG
jgi:hypothetical protein